MAKSKVAAGDICLIPLPGHGFAVAKVLYCLQRFKNIVLLGVWTGGTVPKKELPKQLPEDLALRIYAGSKFVGSTWPVVGHAPLAPSEENASLRVVGRHVYLAEEQVREATREDFKQIPAQEISNEAMVMFKICRALGLPEPSEEE